MYEEDVGYKHPINENNMQKIGANQNHYKDECDARASADASQIATINAWFARDVRMFLEFHSSAIVSASMDDGKRFFALPFLDQNNIVPNVFSAHPDFDFVQYENEASFPYDVNTERKGVMLAVGLSGGGVGVQAWKVGNRT